MIFDISIKCTVCNLLLNEYFANFKFCLKCKSKKPFKHLGEIAIDKHVETLESIALDGAI